MKSPLGKLRRFGLHRNDAVKREHHSLAQFDELAQAAQDMQQMRDCYDSLLSAAAATANSAYEFSESLREMGTCLLEKTALHDDEESGRVLSMLGKVQFELQKLVDSYRSHIFLTITNPSESLLNELRTVEEMKRQCDEKRDVYNMMAQQKEKGRSKGGRGENLTSQQLQTAHEEYDEQATLCVFRLKSLKQGQSRSLLTQAARHHGAQLNFFRKGLRSLETVDPQVRVVTERQHIDYQFVGNEDDDDDEDGDNGYDTNDDGELSFDYRAQRQGPDVSTSRNSMEVDEVGISFPLASAADNSEVNLEKDKGNIQTFSKEQRVNSHSAPIFLDKKADPAEKVRQIQPSYARKVNTYVLPTPLDVKGSASSRSSSSDPHTSSIGGRAQNLWHSSPLEQKKPGKDSSDDYLPVSAVAKAQALVSKESSNNATSSQLPQPSIEGPSLLHLDPLHVSDNKKVKRQAFSGPLTNNKPSSTKPVSSINGPIPSTELSHFVSGTLSCAPIPSSSPKVSPSASPPLVSSPKISELHELPRPPVSLSAKPVKSTGLVGHSAPLLLRSQEFSLTNKMAYGMPSTASPLPTPPTVVPRSFSIPSSSQRTMALHAVKLMEPPQALNKTEAASPPLMPISLAKKQPVGVVSEVTSNSSQIKGQRR